MSEDARCNRSSEQFEDVVSFRHATDVVEVRRSDRIVGTDGLTEVAHMVRNEDGLEESRCLSLALGRQGTVDAHDGYTVTRLALVHQVGVQDHVNGGGQQTRGGPLGHLLDHEGLRTVNKKQQEPINNSAE
jgi:hypothetical protein